MSTRARAGLTWVECTGADYDAYLSMLRAQGIHDPSPLIGALLLSASRTAMPNEFAQLNTLKTWLDSFRPFPPTVVAELKQLYDVRFTYHSNAIEGNTLTQSETELVLTQGITVGGKTLVEHLEVIGHKEAIDYVEALALPRTPLGEWEIKTLHGLILRGVDQVTGRSEAGRYWTLDVKAAGTEHTYPPHYLLPERMQGFIEWLASEDAQARHPVAYAAEAHYRLVSIHPFRDGNGRTGRLLMNLLLIQAGYPITVITNAMRAEYIDALVHAQDSGDDTGKLVSLVARACRAALIDNLRVVSTSLESRGKGQPFYQEMAAFLNADGDVGSR